MNYWQLEVVNQAVTNTLVGVGLALLNLLFCYFVPGAPRVIRVLGRKPQLRWIMFAYLIALVIQIATSPIFRSLIESVYLEIGRSPYQALFNVLGVMLIDILVGAYNGTRRGAEAAGRSIETMREQAEAGLGRLGGGVVPDAQPAEPEGEQEAERKQRLDDRLKDY